MEELEGPLRPGYQVDVLPGKSLDPGIGEAVGLQKRQNEFEDITGFVPWPLVHLHQIIVVAAHLPEKPVPLGLDKLPAELKGVVIEGQRALAIGVQL
jgi:hypothetical protein